MRRWWCGGVVAVATAVSCVVCARVDAQVSMLNVTVCPSALPRHPKGTVSISLEAAHTALLTCFPGHHLSPHGSPNLLCRRRKWVFSDAVYKTCVPTCPPSCPPGDCEAPGLCRCGEEPCAVPRACPDEVNVTVQNAQEIVAGGIGGSALGTCQGGYEVAPGVTQFVVPCVAGTWYAPTHPSGTLVSCRPVCPVPCGNGGVCVAPGRCQCPQGTTGRHCQEVWCGRRPEAPLGMEVVPVSGSTYGLRCLGHYVLQGRGLGATLTVACINGTWTYPDWDADVPLTCVPFCSVPCSNGGRCVAGERCHCPPGFTGRYCRRRTCSPDDLAMQHATFSDNKLQPSSPQYRRYVECNRGWNLPSGHVGKAEVACSRGQWVVLTESSDDNSSKGVQCVPAACNVTCLSGGKCESGRCVCPEGTTGRQCERRTCPQAPPAVTNAWLDRSPVAAFVTCRLGYGVGGTNTSHWDLQCEGGTWGAAHSVEEGCLPVCSPPCLNGGRCAEPDHCVCPSRYSGPRCQFAECLEPIPEMENGVVDNCTDGRLVARCAEGFAFTNGQTELPIECSISYGLWVLPYPASCRPVCEPPCRNGGVCVSPGWCACVEGFAGSACESISCDTIPDTLFNFHATLSGSRLVASCLPEYKFPKGEASLEFTCKDDHWVFPPEYSPGADMACTHRCDPPCRNGGVCEGVGMCRCPAQYTGQHCEEHRCTEPLPSVAHGMFSFIGNRVLVNCTLGPQPRESYWITCNKGSWVPEASSKSTRCPAQCAPSCRNGGVCVSPGVCTCQAGFTGRVCELDLTEVTCDDPPPLVPHGEVVFSKGRAVVTCTPGYMLKGGDTSTQAECRRGVWEFDGMPPVCLPSCVPECQNGGTCVAADVCLCPRGLAGNRCQEGAKCTKPPQVPPDMVLKASDTVYVGSCREGFSLPRSLDALLLVNCTHGFWTKSHALTCLPVCRDACRNGGTCEATDTCHCPEGTENATCSTLVLGTCRAQVEWKNTLVKKNSEGLEVSCARGYKFHQRAPDGPVVLRCEGGEWVKHHTWNWHEELCVPVCDPLCQGGGKCVLPGQCVCEDGSFSSVCEDIKWCKQLPIVSHGVATWIASRLARVHCQEGRRTSGHKRSLVLRCFADQWITSGEEPRPASRIDCVHVCRPSCLNAGHCTGPNKCTCSKNFTGPWCQYPACGTLPLKAPHATLNFTLPNSTAEGLLRCHRGHKLPSGEEAAAFWCSKGVWHFKGGMAGHMTVECRPVCQPPCLNRGECVQPNLCRCGPGFAGRLCERRFSLTVQGSPCVFPFLHRNSWHFSCTTLDSASPWCATQLHPQGTPAAWLFCNASVGLEEVVTTLSGRVCVFPFRDHGVWARRCVSDAQGRAWCPTQLTRDARPLQWDYCWHDEGFRRVLLVETGQPCVLPYVYHGMRHYWCLGEAGDVNLWCPTQVDEHLTPLAWAACVHDHDGELPQPAIPHTAPPPPPPLRSEQNEIKT